LAVDPALGDMLILSASAFTAHGNDGKMIMLHQRGSDIILGTKKIAGAEYLLLAACYLGKRPFNPVTVLVGEGNILDVMV
jgi:hypothetical protein